MLKFAWEWARKQPYCQHDSGGHCRHEMQADLHIHNLPNLSAMTVVLHLLALSYPRRGQTGRKLNRVLTALLDLSCTTIMETITTSCVHWGLRWAYVPHTHTAGTATSTPHLATRHDATSPRNKLCISTVAAVTNVRMVLQQWSCMPHFTPICWLSVKHHLPYQPQPSSSFSLYFITGNISTRVGCRKGTWRLVCHRMTWASNRKNCDSSYISPSSTTTQSMFGYVHCHCKLQCVHMRQLPSKQESIKYHQRWQKHCHMTRNSTCKLQLHLP